MPEGVPQGPPLPFLAAIRNRGDALPSAGVDGKGPVRPKPKPPGTAPAVEVAGHKAKPRLPDHALDVAASADGSPDKRQGPTPSAAALMAGLKGGLPQLKKAGARSPAADKRSAASADSKTPLASKTGTSRAENRHVPAAERERMIQSSSRATPQPFSPPPLSKTPSVQAAPVCSVPAAVPATARGTPTRASESIPVPAVRSTPVKKQPECKLHKSGKYQVIVDPVMVAQSFQQLTCRYG